MEIEREERNGSGYQEKQEFITGIYYEYERLMFATARRYIDDRTEQEDVVQESLKKLIEKYQLKKVKWITPGGKTGQESIYNGLNAMRGQIEEDSIVLIHDGVRPLINEELISENIKVAKEKGNAITVVEATETVMMVNEKNELTQSVERKKCRFARAPQTYIYGQLLAAHDHAREENINSYIDSATLMQAEGYKLFPVMGKPENIKITTPSDFYTFRAIVEAEENSQILGF